ncbi:MAG: chemotaxis protein CheW [Candidatus Hydrogenedentes bacterium]|nr:chemotaxis protein CheW [Candidatus Hydrogenedentota bacterium]
MLSRSTGISGVFWLRRKGLDLAMNEMFDDGLVSEFIAESRDHLDTIEPDLLALESGEESGDIVNRIFRAIHSIKGGAGFLSYEHLRDLSHAMENALMLLRDGGLALSPALADVLLAGVDKLRVMIDDLEGSDTVPIAGELEKLSAIVSGSELGAPAAVSAPAPAAAPGAVAAPAAPTSKVAPPGEPQGAFDLSHDKVRNAVRHGLNIFAVKLERSLFEPEGAGRSLAGFLENLRTVGECLDSTFDSNDTNTAYAASEVEYILFGSVLEADLAPVALEVEASCVHAIEIKPGAASAIAAHNASDGATTDSKPPESRTAAKAPKGEVSDSLRVRVSLLTDLMNLAGELVLARNQLLRMMEDQADTVPGLVALMQSIDHVTTDLQEGIMRTRMQPIGTVLSKYQRVVRDLARQLGKEIEITIDGSEVEVDKTILESLSDPLTHIIRNCADHALEPPAEREAMGKRREGRIAIHAFHEDGQIKVSISDDGRGIDPEKVSRKAVEKGLISEAERARMGDRDKVNLVFAPGFSMAATISAVSGRGVGMDVVRTNIEKIGGTIELESAVNEGTTVLLQLPLTLAIVPSMITGVADQRFAIPQVNIEEFVWIRANEVAERIERIQGQDVLRLRGMLMPLVRLSTVLDIDDTFIDPRSGSESASRRKQVADRRSPDGALIADDVVEPAHDRAGADRRVNWHSDYNVVVVKNAGNKFGLIVDRLFDGEEIVVNPLPGHIKDCRCFTGNTILGDGKVVMILDVVGVAEVAKLHFANVEEEERKRQAEERRREAERAKIRKSIILFHSAPGEYFAVQQDAVMRLERIQRDAIELVGNQEFVQYRGKGLPLIRLDSYLPVQPIPDDTKEFFLIIPKVAQKQENATALAGIVATRIVDAFDAEMELQKEGLNTPGLLGSAVIRDHLTLLIEPDQLTCQVLNN